MSAVEAVRELPSRIDALLDDLHQTADPGVGDRADELVRAVVGLYGAGLERIVERLQAHPDADRLVRDLAADDIVGNLLLLHDLHPDSVETRIVAALDRVRPYLGSHAGGIVYHGIDDDGVAQLELSGSCDGCPSSAVTVQTTIERALLEAAPELTGVQVEGMVAAKPVGPLQIGRRPVEPVSDHWMRVTLTATPGHSEQLDADGTRALVCNLADSYVAYRIECPRCTSPLTNAVLLDAELRCMDCDARYDVRHAGTALGGGPGLTPLPLLPDGDGWQIAVPDLVAS
jgi:Fe-S cluster biogenesis protein NfuA